MKSARRIGCYSLFVLAYALAAASVMFLANLAGCASDSVFMKVLWFASGYLFSGYLHGLVFPYLDERFP